MSNHLYSCLIPAERDRDRPCLVTAGGRRLTYGEIDRISARYASALQSCGVQRGDRVAVQVEKSPEALFVYLGCIRAGAAFLPLNTAYTLHEIEYFVRDAEPALLIGRPEQAADLEALADKCGTKHFETLGADGSGSMSQLAEKQTGNWVDVDCGPEDLATILYTSGTTGRSKGAMLSHENLRSNAQALVETWHFSPDDTLIHALPIFHAHGLFVATNVTMLAGARMIFLPKFDPEEALGWMPEATVMMGVPTFYTRLLQNPKLSRQTTNGMRLFISGSAPLLAETHKEFQERTGHAILERYGMTETSMNTSNPYDGDRVPGSVGFPLSNVEVRVCEPETGRMLGADEIGVIEVRGPNVFSSYWRMPEKTAQEFRPDGFFITGDLGKIDARGYVWILGRQKDLVISGGYNVYPKELELEIDAIPGVMESAVIGIAHADLGEAVTAVVVRQSGSAISEAEILTLLRKNLAGYKIPKRVIFTDELPRNTMAKVQKNVLREQNKALYEA